MPRDQTKQNHSASNDSASNKKMRLFPFRSSGSSNRNKPKSSRNTAVIEQHQPAQQQQHQQQQLEHQQLQLQLSLNNSVVNSNGISDVINGNGSNFIGQTSPGLTPQHQQLTLSGAAATVAASSISLEQLLHRLSLGLTVPNNAFTQTVLGSLPLFAGVQQLHSAAPLPIGTGVMQPSLAYLQLLNLQMAYNHALAQMRVHQQVQTECEIQHQQQHLPMQHTGNHIFHSISQSPNVALPETTSNILGLKNSDILESLTEYVHLQQQNRVQKPLNSSHLNISGPCSDFALPDFNSITTNNYIEYQQNNLNFNLLNCQHNSAFRAPQLNRPNEDQIFNNSHINAYGSGDQILTDLTPIFTQCFQHQKQTTTVVTENVESTPCFHDGSQLFSGHGTADNFNLPYPIEYRGTVYYSLRPMSATHHVNNSEFCPVKVKGYARRVFFNGKDYEFDSSEDPPAGEKHMYLMISDHAYNSEKSGKIEEKSLPHHIESSSAVTLRSRYPTSPPPRPPARYGYRANMLAEQEEAHKIATDKECRKIQASVSCLFDAGHLINTMEKSVALEMKPTQSTFSNVASGLTQFNEDEIRILQNTFAASNEAQSHFESELHSSSQFAAQLGQYMDFAKSIVASPQINQEVLEYELQSSTSIVSQFEKPINSINQMEMAANSRQFHCHFESQQIDFTDGINAASCASPSNYLQQGQVTNFRNSNSSTILSDLNFSNQRLTKSFQGELIPESQVYERSLPSSNSVLPRIDSQSKPFAVNAFETSKAPLKCHAGENQEFGLRTRQVKDKSGSFHTVTCIPIKHTPLEYSLDDLKAMRNSRLAHVWKVAYNTDVFKAIINKEKDTCSFKSLTKKAFRSSSTFQTYLETSKPFNNTDIEFKPSSLKDFCRPILSEQTKTGTIPKSNVYRSKDYWELGNFAKQPNSCEAAIPQLSSSFQNRHQTQSNKISNQKIELTETKKNLNKSINNQSYVEGTHFHRVNSADKESSANSFKNEIKLSNHSSTHEKVAGFNVTGPYKGIWEDDPMSYDSLSGAIPKYDILLPDRESISNQIISAEVPKPEIRKYNAVATESYTCTPEYVERAEYNYYHPVPQIAATNQFIQTESTFKGTAIDPIISTINSPSNIQLSPIFQIYNGGLVLPPTVPFIPHDKFNGMSFASSLQSGINKTETFHYHIPSETQLRYQSQSKSQSQCQFQLQCQPQSQTANEAPKLYSTFTFVNQFANMPATVEQTEPIQNADSKLSPSIEAIYESPPCTQIYRRSSERSFIKRQMCNQQEQQQLKEHQVRSTMQQLSKHSLADGGASGDANSFLRAKAHANASVNFNANFRGNNYHYYTKNNYLEACNEEAMNKFSTTERSLKSVVKLPSEEWPPLPKPRTSPTLIDFVKAAKSFNQKSSSGKKQTQKNVAKQPQNGVKQLKNSALKQILSNVSKKDKQIRQNKTPNANIGKSQKDITMN